MQERKPKRRFRLVLPREHGAWAMLVIPYLTGALSLDAGSGHLARLVLGLVGIVLLFMMRSPVITLARRRYRRGDYGADAHDLRMSALTYLGGALTVFAAVGLVYGDIRLAPMALLALAAAAVQSWLAVTRGERSLAAELSGVMLLTLTASLGVMLAGGDPWARPAITLWAANASFFAASVFNVKMKVAAMVARSDRFDWGDRVRIGRDSIAYLAAVLAAWTAASLAGVAPRRAVIVFLPLAGYLCWSLVRMNSGLKIKTEGFVQLGLSLAFAVLVVIVWRAGW